MKSGRLIVRTRDASGKPREQGGRQDRMRIYIPSRSARDARAHAPHPRRVLVMDASVLARLGSRQHGRRRSTATSISAGEPREIF